MKIIIDKEKLEARITAWKNTIPAGNRDKKVRRDTAVDELQSILQQGEEYTSPKQEGKFIKSDLDTHSIFVPNSALKQEESSNWDEIEKEYVKFCNSKNPLEKRVNEFDWLKEHYLPPVKR